MKYATVDSPGSRVSKIARDRWGAEKRRGLKDTDEAFLGACLSAFSANPDFRPKRDARSRTPLLAFT
jgi:hypothetical protein